MIAEVDGRISADPADGAWVAAVENRSTGLGSGAAPTLMRAGDDRLVVITDGADLMNLTLYWGSLRAGGHRMEHPTCVSQASHR
ncbi:MAG TPA: hypothetical protein VFZ79_16265 [Acidimicrobiales bacterium]